jgi:hypothetical protein
LIQTGETVDVQVCDDATTDSEQTQSKFKSYSMKIKLKL